MAEREKTGKESAEQGWSKPQQVNLVEGVILTTAANRAKVETRRTPVEGQEDMVVISIATMSGERGRQFDREEASLRGFARDLLGNMGKPMSEGSKQQFERDPEEMTKFARDLLEANEMLAKIKRDRAQRPD